MYVCKGQQLLLMLACLLATACGTHHGVSEDEPDEADLLSDDEIESARSVPHHSAARYDVTGADGYEGTYDGIFLFVSNDGATSFSISAHDSDHTGRSISATLNLSAAETDALLEQGIVSVTPTEEWSWLYDNRGTLMFQGLDPEVDAQIRDFEVRRLDDGTFAASLAGVHMERLIAATQTVEAGEDVRVTVAGRLLGTCMTTDEDGTVRPVFEGEDDLCAAMAGE